MTGREEIKQRIYEAITTTFPDFTLVFFEQSFRPDTDTYLLVSLCELRRAATRRNMFYATYEVLLTVYTTQRDAFIVEKIMDRFADSLEQTSIASKRFVYQFGELEATTPIPTGDGSNQIVSNVKTLYCTIRVSSKK